MAGAGLVVVVGGTGAAPARASTPLWLPLGGDQVYRADGGSGGGSSGGAVPGRGYALYQDSGLLPGGYTIRLVTSVNVEELRPEVETAAADLGAITGIPVTVAAGTIVGREAGFGEVVLEVSETAPCTGTWAGCGGPQFGAGPKAGVSYVTGGHAWLRHTATTYAADAQQHLVSHELGHAFGLDHYDGTWDGRTQVMHSTSYDASRYGSGDRNGLVAERDRGAVPPANDVFWWGGDARAFTVQDASVPGDDHPYAGDFDGDGRGDLLFADHVLWGTATRGQLERTDVAGGSLAGSPEPVVGDFDADGRDDVLAGGRLLWANADRTFSVATAPVGAGGRQPVAGDFDGDGASDVRLADRVLWGVPRLRRFLSTPVDDAVSGAPRLVAGDFDGDGFDDVLGVAPDGDHVRWGGPLHGGSSTAVDLGLTVGDAATVFAGDFDGDGRADVYVHDGSRVDHVLWGRADRRFDPTDATADTGRREPVAQDYDGDGRTDILWFRAGDA